jgi:hypothetical protein
MTTDNSSVAQHSTHRLVAMLAPGVDVRMTCGPHKGELGWIVGFEIPAPDSREGGWRVYLPQCQEAIITVPAHFRRVTPASAPRIPDLTPHPPTRSELEQRRLQKRRAYRAEVRARKQQQSGTGGAA